MTRPVDRRLAFMALIGAVACGEDGPAFIPAEGPARFAVVRTDYQSTAIAILNPEGEVIDPALFSSGSLVPGLVAALSGDVVVPGPRLHTAGVVNVIDRFGTDVLTRVEIATGEVLGQLRVAPSRGGFSSNPRDLVITRPDRGFISRSGVNLDPEAPAADRGNDLVELDPIRLELTGRRVDLSRFDTTATVAVDAGIREVPVYARPGRMALVSGRIVVALEQLSFEFDAASRGQVALVDPDSLAVDALELPAGVRNCGTLTAVPGVEDLVLIACSGFSRPFGQPEQIRASSGVFLARVTPDTADIVRSWRPLESDRPLAVHAVLPLGPDRFLGVAHGVLGGAGDRAFVVDVATGASTLLFRSKEAFTIGEAALDPATGRLLVPDRAASGGGLRRFRRAGPGAPWTPEPTVRFDDGPLPPSAVTDLP